MGRKLKTWLMFLKVWEWRWIIHRSSALKTSLWESCDWQTAHAFQTSRRKCAEKWTEESFFCIFEHKWRAVCEKDVIWTTFKLLNSSYRLVQSKKGIPQTPVSGRGVLIRHTHPSRHRFYSTSLCGEYNSIMIHSSSTWIKSKVSQQCRGTVTWLFCRYSSCCVTSSPPAWQSKFVFVERDVFLSINL